MSIDAIIAARVLHLRHQRGLSLAELAERADVSKSMISKVERGESSPTAAVLGRLAAGLGVPLSQLIGDEMEPPQRLTARARQDVWQDPATGYIRRQVSPARDGVELVEVELPAGAQISYPRWNTAPYRQYLWLVSGALRVEYGDEHFELNAGDCLDFGVDRNVMFAARDGCRYLLVMNV
ncbi:helix-turn-helix domain-containing protein [Amantichitinum ursilacus]|uniref:HTH-type transcriptional regulator SinR n=1 Tax=Amantichitinum ursilacus TaxID=857265 RepID=A0A0N0GM17_9NEIS|nr:XRE family transcriptional regulator [Amantichitinum ursilacus]KPC50636.1 HTH-type transcriptional regulator SinR [Amantichitinum ursilacus]